MMTKHSRKSTRDEFKDKAIHRFYQTLDHLLLILQVFVVYATSLIADLGLYYIVHFSMRDVIANSQIASLWFERFVIFLAFLTMVGFAVHTILSVLMQIRFEVGTLGE